MSKPQLEKAIITVLDGADKNKVITVLFNPTEYSVDRTNSYKAMAIPGLGSPILQFVNGECDQLSMERNATRTVVAPNGDRSLDVL